MTKITEILLGFYCNNSNRLDMETIELVKLWDGTGELTVRYPNGAEKRISVENLGVPRVRVEESRSDMFVYGDVTEAHVIKCIEAYRVALTREIAKIADLREDRRKESTIWTLRNVKLNNA